MKQILLLAILFSAHAVSAQTKGQVEISGATVEQLKLMKGFQLTLFDDAKNNGELTQKEQMVTKANGQFKFSLDHNSIYVLECAKEGYATKKMRFDTAMEGVKADSTVRFEFMIDMVPASDGAPGKGPVNVYYDASRKMFDYKLE